MKLEPQVRALLSRPNFAHVSTVMPDGSPNNSPVWIDVQGDRILINFRKVSLQGPKPAARFACRNIRCRFP